MGEDSISPTFEEIGRYEVEPKYIQPDYQKRLGEHDIKLSAHWKWIQ